MSGWSCPQCLTCCRARLTEVDVHLGLERTETRWLCDTCLADIDTSTDRMIVADRTGRVKERPSRHE